MDWTARQLDAVDVAKAGRDTCIVAGPGSGKTSVLVEFYRRLVVEAHVSPQRILAITFTEKAARNMKEKLADSFRNAPELRRQLEQANVSTIHGFCARLLRENSIVAGIDPEFRVLDARQAIILQRRTASDALDRMFADRPDEMRALMCGLGSPDLAGGIPEVYEAMRAAGVTPGELRNFEMRGASSLEDVRAAIGALGNENTASWNRGQLARLGEVLEAALRVKELPDGPVTREHFEELDRFPTSLKGTKQHTTCYSRLKKIKDDMLPDFGRAMLVQYYSRERETLIAAIECFDRLYSERKRALGVLDYADLEVFAVRLLAEDAGIRARVRDEFQHVLMDELQDTNGQQAKLLELVRRPDRFYAVGDINQSIYGFRHANPEVFRAYRDEIESGGKHLVELVENWRSRPDILSAVETVSHFAGGIERRDLVAAREFEQKSEASVEVLAGIADTQDAALELEARWVARRIGELKGSLQLAGRPARFGDVAVLMRNSEVARAFVLAFEEAGVPYLLNQSKGFFEAREVVDLAHLLRVIDNPRDEISLAAVLRSPMAAVSDEALLRLKGEGNLASALRRLDHLDAAFAAGDLSKLHRFREQLLGWREARDTSGFDRLLMRAMDETGYGAEPGTRPARNIEKFLAMAREASSRLTLAEFVDELGLMRQADARDTDVAPEDAVNAVRMMTVHAAKGLEFPIVFLVALHKGMQQGVAPLCFSSQRGLGARWLSPASGEDTGDWFHAAIREEAKVRDAHESDRLLYVAMTRAAEHLVFSWSSFGRPKEWAAVVEEAFEVDMNVPQQKVKLVEAPDGERFPLRVFASNAAPVALARAAQEIAAVPVQIVEQPALRDQHDFAASVTSVALFAHCPRLYYLERYLGWRGNAPRHLRAVEEEPDDELDSSEFGRAVHRLLAGQPGANATPEARRLAETFHASDLGQRTRRAARIEREFDFLTVVEDVVLRGQIDLWFEKSGELVLVDYKTDDVKAREAAARAEFYAPQLRLYALALERMLGRAPDQAFLYFLRPGVAVPVTLESSLWDNPEALVREFREAQSSPAFPLREGEHCARCPHFHGLCPAGSGMADVIHPAAIHGEDLAGDEAGIG